MCGQGDEPEPAETPHRFDPAVGEKLEDETRFRFLSRDELVDALDPDPESVVADIGSGTGFYTREVAPFVRSLIAIDMQPSMHQQFRSHGIPPNVRQVLARGNTLPVPDGALDGAYSTMTFHEYGPGGLSELARAIRSGGRLVVADWSADGGGDRGPPLAVRADVGDAAETVERAGFDIETARARPETFVIAAVRP